eukprot:TRINITY_DN7498_c0_g1_i1.p1 TRINITY_DN7498_c0_g1~~TRINITY_DN7498_c0_g1_i1.p1  ORF type:complete len:179 (+),score=51.38 TRINITY_DN7498_c0_g1_i1:542-1078(+)
MKQGNMTGVDKDALVSSAGQLACSIFLKSEAFERKKRSIKEKEKRQIRALQEKRRLLMSKKEKKMQKETLKLEKRWQQDKAWGDDARLGALKEACVAIIRNEMMMSGYSEVEPPGRTMEEAEMMEQLTNEGAAGEDALEEERNEAGLGGSTQSKKPEEGQGGEVEAGQTLQESVKPAR